MDLVAANPEHLDMVIFPAGWGELRIPPAPERVIEQELPPWM